MKTIASNEKFHESWEALQTTLGRVLRAAHTPETDENIGTLRNAYTSHIQYAIADLNTLSKLIATTPGAKA